MSQALSRPQAAERLGLSVRALDRLIRAGKLSVRKPSPRVVRLDAAEVQAYWEASKVAPPEEPLPAPRRGAPNTGNPVLDQALRLQRKMLAEERKRKSGGARA